jgi:hypothetical protein
MDKLSRRLIFALVAGSFIFLCIMFGPVLIDAVVAPLARAAWLLLRLFILSVDQIIIWYIVIVAFSLLVLFRYSIIGISQPTVEEEPPVQNFYVKNLGIWKLYFDFRVDYPGSAGDLKRELALMLVTLYASRKHISADYEVYNGFSTGEIPLPEPVFSFLFGKQNENKRFNPRHWFNRITGRDKAAFYSDLETALTYLENYLEIADEHKKDHD